MIGFQFSRALNGVLDLRFAKCTLEYRVTVGPQLGKFKQFAKSRDSLNRSLGSPHVIN